MGLGKTASICVGVSVPAGVYVALTLIPSLWGPAGVERVGGIAGRILSLWYGQWLALCCVLCFVWLGERVFHTWLDGVEIKKGSLDRWLMAFAGGCWISIFALLAFAALAPLKYSPLLTVPLLLSVLLSCLRRSEPSTISLGRGADASSELLRFLPLVLVPALCVVLTPMWAMSLLPNSNWDSATLHLPLAHWYLNHGLSSIPSSRSRSWVQAACNSSTRRCLLFKANRR